jgi:hypothetical protein
LEAAEAKGGTASFPSLGIYILIAVPAKIVDPVPSGFPARKQENQIKS